MRYFLTATALTTLLVGSTLASNQEFLGLKEGVHRYTFAEGFGVNPNNQRILQISPEETVTVTEEEKWQMKRNGINFMDITDVLELGTSIRAQSKKRYVYPSGPQFQTLVHPILGNLTTKYMKENLETFTNFYTRYYKSDTGRQSGEWLLQKVKSVASESGNADIDVSPFIHPWGQNSVIAHIPPKNLTVSEVQAGENQSTTNVIIGAHQDSVNLLLPMYLRSPGADDDGSGTVTILEAFRVLTQYGPPMKNPVEFQWYSGEEAGLLGSAAIFQEYEKKGKKVGAMLQQDMTGYIQGTLDAGEKESVGVITDYVDPGLTDFIKTIITEYCDIPFVETKCGYACSDHASATKAGYPSAFVIESTFKNSDHKIHSTSDTIDRLSFDHMLQHAKMTLALVIELGLADLELE